VKSYSWSVIEKLVNFKLVETNNLKQLEGIL
jgi:hypothetical protein